jgi:hypothetical protein
VVVLLIATKKKPASILQFQAIRVESAHGLESADGPESGDGLESAHGLTLLGWGVEKRPTITPNL